MWQDKMRYKIARKGNEVTLYLWNVELQDTEEFSIYVSAGETIILKSYDFSSSEKNEKMLKVVNDKEYCLLEEIVDANPRSSYFTFKFQIVDGDEYVWKSDDKDPYHILKTVEEVGSRKVSGLSLILDIPETEISEQLETTLFYEFVENEKSRRINFSVRDVYDDLKDIMQQVLLVLDPDH